MENEFYKENKVENLGNKVQKLGNKGHCQESLKGLLDGTRTPRVPSRNGDRNAEEGFLLLRDQGNDILQT